MPRTDVEVAPAGIVPTSVLIGAGLSKVGRHHIKGCIAHGKTEPNITNHGSDEVTIVAVSRAGVSGSIGLAIERRGDRHHAFLPR